MINSINTRDKLIQYIRSMLGEPQIRVELTDVQISYIIDKVIQKYTEYAMGAELERASIIDVGINTSIRLSDDINFILGVYTAQSSFGSGIMTIMPNANGTIVFDSNNAILKTSESVGNLTEYIISMTNYNQYLHYFNQVVAYDWSDNSKILKILDGNRLGSKYLIHVSKVYIPRDDLDPNETDLIYNNPWVKDMCIAETQLRWGKMVGKYTQNLVGGAQINFDRMISEAQQEIEKLENDLYEKYTEPLGVWID